MSYTVSVAMATYNGEKYLREQLDSLYNQTRIPDEIVVCDDRSSDHTVDILEEYHQKYGLIYYVNEKSLGINKNFEKAVSACKGDYIGISDQDDVWYPNKIEVSINKLREIEGSGRIPSAVSSKAQRVDADLNKIPTVIPDHDIDRFEESIFRYLAQGSSLFFNRELLKILLPFPEKELLYDDYIGTAAACVGNKCFIAQFLMAYRLHGNNAHAQYGKKSDKRLIDKILFDISSPKYNTLISSQRLHAVEYIYNRFCNILKPDVKAYINKLLLYRYGKLSEKISSVRFLVPDKKERRKIMCITILMHFIPIKEYGKYTCKF